MFPSDLFHCAAIAFDNYFLQLCFGQNEKPVFVSLNTRTRYSNKNINQIRALDFFWPKVILSFLFFIKSYFHPISHIIRPFLRLRRLDLKWHGAAAFVGS